MIDASQYLARAKRKDNDAWETGSLVIIRRETSEEQVFLAEKMTGALIPVQAETVGRFTGLTDKNGKKIFEGDIVRNGDHTMIVIWCDFHAAFKLAFRVDGDHFEVMSNSHIYLEIIGNLYDNPELLGGVSDGN